MLGEHSAGVRRWYPAFLAAFTFQGVPAVASLLRAIDVLRATNYMRTHPANIGTDHFNYNDIGKIMEAFNEDVWMYYINP
jgi:hypothetical protein